MRNQPFNSYLPADERSGGNLIDPPSALRFRILTALFVLAAAIVLVRVAWVQSQLQQEYLAALNSTTVEYESIPARDGRILSEDAVVLAADVDQYEIQLHYRWLQDPVDEEWLQRRVRSQLSRSERRDENTVELVRMEIQSDRRTMWQRLAAVLGMADTELAARRSDIQSRVERISEAVNRRLATPVDDDSTSDGLIMEVAEAVRRALTTAPRRTVSDRIVVREEESWHTVVSDIPLDIAGQIRDQSQFFPGVRVVAGSRRIYPLSDLAPHIVGARTDSAEQDTANELKQALDVQRTGQFGVERTYNRDLQGQSGLRRIVRDRRMRIMESVVERNPLSGRDVVLTLNLSLQKHAERLLDEALTDRPGEFLSEESDSEDATAPKQIPTGGAIVVMEVATGRVLTAASAPRFSLALFTEAKQEDWNAANADPRHPFLNRVIQTALTPGSVVKPVSAAAALTTGVINPDEPFYCQGFLERPDQHRCLLFRLTGHGHGDIDLTRAIAQSCNVYFFEAARRIGFRRLRGWFDQFGFGRATGIDLPFEAAGTLPGSSSAEGDIDHQFRHETLGLSIGQSRVTVTPMQMVRAIAAIANGGWLVTPHVVSIDGTPRKTTDVDSRPRDVVRRRISSLSDDALNRIREGMTATVEQPYGTAFRTTRLSTITIAGKTGTAQTAGGRPDHAWFVGFFPSEAPKFAVAIVLEHGGSGSRAAGPVAREIVREMQALALVP